MLQLINVTHIQICLNIEDSNGCRGCSLRLQEYTNLLVNDISAVHFWWIRQKWALWERLMLVICAGGVLSPGVFLPRSIGTVVRNPPSTGGRLCEVNCIKFMGRWWGRGALSGCDGKMSTWHWYVRRPLVRVGQMGFPRPPCHSLVRKVCGCISPL